MNNYGGNPAGRAWEVLTGTKTERDLRRMLA